MIPNSNFESKNIVEEPHSFEAIMRLWTKFFSMDTRFFLLEIPRTDGLNTLVGVIVYAVVITVNSMMTTALTFSETMSKIPLEYTEFMPDSSTILLISLCGGLIGTPLTFYIGNGILFGIAKLFGGRGEYAVQTYLQSLYIVPLGIITLVLYLISLVPILGNFIYYPVLFGVSIFGIILSVRSIKATHDFTTGRAVLVVIAPMIVVFALFACILIVSLSALGPASQGTFSNIIVQMLV